MHRATLSILIQLIISWVVQHANFLDCKGDPACQDDMTVWV